MAASAPRSASVTGSNTPPRDLSSAPIELRKNGRITSLETCASRSTNAAKSTAVIAPPPRNLENRALWVAFFAYQPCLKLREGRLRNCREACNLLFLLANQLLASNRRESPCGKNVAHARILRWTLRN